MSHTSDLDTLVAHHEITEVLVAYCSCLDRMNLAALAGLFTEDCSVIYGDDPALEASGRANLEKSLARMWRWKRTAHHMSNIRVVLVEGGAAEVESYVHAWHETPDGQTATIFGRYLDSFVRTEEGWKIARRRMDMNGADEGFKVPIPPAPRTTPPPGWRPPESLD